MGNHEVPSGFIAVPQSDWESDHWFKEMFSGTNFDTDSGFGFTEEFVSRQIDGIESALGDVECQYLRDEAEGWVSFGLGRGGWFFSPLYVSKIVWYWPYLRRDTPEITCRFLVPVDSMLLTTMPRS